MRCEGQQRLRSRQSAVIGRHVQRSDASARCSSPLTPHPSRPKASQTGFTLVELLAVLVIVTIMAVAALLSVDLVGAGGKLDDEARRFATVAELMCEEAVLTSTEQGVHLSEAGYAFARWNGEVWEPQAGRVYRPHPFPDQLRAELVVGGHLVLFGETEDPQVICYSTGEMTPFELTLELPDAPRLVLTGDGLGEVELAH